MYFSRWFQIWPCNSKMLTFFTKCVQFMTCRLHSPAAWKALKALGLEIFIVGVKDQRLYIHFESCNLWFLYFINHIFCDLISLIDMIFLYAVSLLSLPYPLLSVCLSACHYLYLYPVSFFFPVLLRLALHSFWLQLTIYIVKWRQPFSPNNTFSLEFQTQRFIWDNGHSTGGILWGLCILSK